jgi:signal transduction histidine kinase
VPDRLRGAFGLRLGLWYALLFTAGSTLLTVLTYALLSKSLAERDHELVLSALAQYAGAYEREGLEAVQRAVARDRTAGRHEGLFVRLVGPEAEAVFASVPGSWSGLDLGRLPTTVDPGPPSFLRIPGPGADFEVATVRLRDGTLFHVGKSSETRVDILARFRAWAALLLVLSCALAVAVGLLVTRKALRPLRDLHAALEGIVHTGQVETRVPERGDGDPLDDLSHVFNEMLARIESLIQGLRGSLDNVAHDLRTPLARLRATAEGALSKDEDPEAQRTALVRCVEECDRLSTTLTTLMDISEAETGTMALHRREVEAGDLVRDALALYEDIAEEKGIALTGEAAAGLRLDADPVRVRQALANLVDNAVKYTPRGGHVRLRARGEGGHVLFECEDDGPGIPAEDLPRIWDRLYRGDRSRSERGLGLGLSLVRAIALAHGGGVRVESTLGAGSRFFLTL